MLQVNEVQRLGRCNGVWLAAEDESRIILGHQRLA